MPKTIQKNSGIGGKAQAACTTTSSAYSSIKDHEGFLWIKKLKGKRIVLIAAKHNLREIAAELGADSHIDVNRIPDNYILQGADTAAGVAEYESSLLADAEFPHPLRKNTVRAIELLFSLPPDSDIDHRKYFEDAAAWADRCFAAPVLSAVVHLDESAPHCHVLILPLVDSRMIGSDLVGDKKRFNAIMDAFYKEVAGKYGLSRPKPKKRLSAAVRYDLAAKVLARIKSNPDILNEPNIKDILIDAIAANPALIAAALGIDIPQPKPPQKKTFVGTMTKPQKPEKPSKPIGNEFNQRPENARSLSCVGNEINPPVIDTTEPEQDTYQRIHENDQNAGDWDRDLGEFIQATSKPRTSSPAIEQTRAQIIQLQARRFA